MSELEEVKGMVSKSLRTADPNCEAACAWLEQEYDGVYVQATMNCEILVWVRTRAGGLGWMNFTSGSCAGWEEARARVSKSVVYGLLRVMQ